VSGRDRRSERLHAYRDRELSPRAARRMAARLGPEDRAELARVEAVGDWVRAAEDARAVAAPDLWDAIALRLPAIDAQLGEAAAPRGWLPRLWRPLAAGAALAVVGIVLALGLLREPEHTADVVQWLDAEGAPVMVLEGPGEDTIIWVLGPSPGPDEISGSGRRVSV
jgi:hypothetical protein